MGYYRLIPELLVYTQKLRTKLQFTAAKWSNGRPYKRQKLAHIRIIIYCTYGGNYEINNVIRALRVILLIYFCPVEL